LQRLIFLKYHSILAALGIDKIIGKLKQSFYWPAMKQSVAEYVKKCDSCAVQNSYLLSVFSLYGEDYTILGRFAIQNFYLGQSITVVVFQTY
jgi:hypothetical protein